MTWFGRKVFVRWIQGLCRGLFGHFYCLKEETNFRYIATGEIAGVGYRYRCRLCGKMHWRESGRF